jgi:dolichyl-phosphate-mannose-protein mannosyltransferase
MKAEGHIPASLRNGLLGLFAIALSLHMWGLGWFNSLVFDEVYYVPFALHYLKGETFFDAHPPLGKYLIALALVIGQPLAEGLNWPTFLLADHPLSALGYRWLNALAGATLPLIVALLAFFLSLAYSLQRRLVFAFGGAAFVLMSGLPLVESRFALINIYWVWFGLLGQLCWLAAGLRGRSTPSFETIPELRRTPVLAVAAGVCLGAAINVKWNGAGFWLGLVILEFSSRFGGWSREPWPSTSWKALPLYLGVIPLLTYSLLWLPHLWLNQVSWIEIHRQLWEAHQSIGDAVAPHPYCSAWYTWPLMLRPVAFFYQYVTSLPLDSIHAPTPDLLPTTYTVQGMGNPLMWWLATAAVIALGAGWLSQWLKKLSPGDGYKDSAARRANPDLPPHADQALSHSRGYGPGGMGGDGVSLVVRFVLVNYAANWLPWMVVGRCTFLYHALGMVVFSGLALAWLMSRWWLDHRWHYRVLAWIMGLTTLWGFWFWLPILIGLPLSPEALQQRWWLASWI